MKTVISCSRRTDFSFYYDWLQQVLKDGKVERTNQYNSKPYVVSLKPEDIHSIVLWSKNFGPVLRDPGLLDRYNLFFQFTITGYGASLEPHVIDTDVAVKQAKDLARRYSPEQVNWRFDPILLATSEMKNRSECVAERLETFSWLCRELSEVGIRRCTFSFATMYDTVERRLKKNGFYIHHVPLDIQKEMLGSMVATAAEQGIQLFTCAQPLVEGVPGVQKGHCVDGELLAALFGDRTSVAKDKGQREACGCTASKDIGGYDQPCKHRCLYCYARPEE